MVDFNNNTDSQAAMTITDVVCPICFWAIENPVIMTEGADEVGRRLRTYFGYCAKCGDAHVVIQFARGDRWVIHKFRPAVVLGLANFIEISDNWKLLSELPPVKQEISDQRPQTEETGIMASLIEMHKAMTSCATTIELLLRHLSEKRGQSIDD